MRIFHDSQNETYQVLLAKSGLIVALQLYHLQKREECYLP